MPYYYAYPSFNFIRRATADYFELINHLTQKAVGPAPSPPLYAWSPEFSLGGGPGPYLAGLAVLPILDCLSVSGNVAINGSGGMHATGALDYTYADIGVTATYKGLRADLRYSGTD